MNIASKLDLLRKDGHRITRVRQKLLEIFTQEQLPLSVKELISQLKQGRIEVNKTTVYRELEFLLKQKFVSVVDLSDGAKRFESSDSDHHHHLICDNCGSIEDMPLNDHLLERELIGKTKFKVQRHALEFFGFCADCQ